MCRCGCVPVLCVPFVSRAFLLFVGLRCVRAALTVALIVRLSSRVSNPSLSPLSLVCWRLDRQQADERPRWLQNTRTTMGTASQRQRQTGWALRRNGDLHASVWAHGAVRTVCAARGRKIAKARRPRSRAQWLGPFFTELARSRQRQRQPKQQWPRGWARQRQRQRQGARQRRRAVGFARA